VIIYILFCLFIYLQIKINELQEEEEKLRKIINIVRPTTLPELTNPLIDDNIPIIEQVVKVNPKSNNSPSPITSTIPKEVKKIDTKIIPNVEKNEKVVINKVKKDLNEAEGNL